MNKMDESTGEPWSSSHQVSIFDLAAPLVGRWKILLVGSLLTGALTFGLTFFITPKFTATTTFIPPQQQQSAAASALASLGALSGLVGATGAIKSPAEQYISLMQSVSVSDRVIEQFKLMQVYDAKYRSETRKKLAQNVRIALGKKDGLITVAVDDTDPQRAADMANQLVDELRRVTSDLALTEAQQRRIFFEEQLKQTRDKLVVAQRALETSGFNAGAFRAEPKTAAESYARLKAEVSAAEVRLQTLRRGLADSTPEVQRQQTVLTALQGQIGKLEATSDAPASGDYVGKYREFKYQESLFELFSRQFELARVDESREGTLIQVVDVAQPPERRSWPRRSLLGAAGFVGGFILIALAILSHHQRRIAHAPQPVAA